MSVEDQRRRRLLRQQQRAARQQQRTARAQRRTARSQQASGSDGDRQAGPDQADQQ